MLAVATFQCVRALLHRHAGMDLLTLLTMAGALLLEQYLAGAIIAFMFASGRPREEYARGCVRRELTALIERAPRIAHHYTNAGIEDIAVEAVLEGDRLLLKPGGIVPLDALLFSKSA